MLFRRAAFRVFLIVGASDFWWGGLSVLFLVRVVGSTVSVMVGLCASAFRVLLKYVVKSELLRCLSGHLLMLHTLCLSSRFELLQSFLLHSFAQLSTRLQIKLCRCRFFINNRCFFIAEENLDLIRVVSDQDHIVKSDSLLALLDS